MSDEESINISEAISAPEIPSFSKIDVSKYYDFETYVSDYTELEDHNKAVKEARLGLFEVTELINKYERLERRSKTIYDREWRRAYLTSSERTETAKKVRADLVCEKFEDAYITHQQVKNELVRTSNTLRLELQSQEALGNNIRQQMKH